MAETVTVDVAVVGAGPAGVAAASRAAESGATALLLDEAPAPGGQIHRHLPGEKPPRGARPWLDRLAQSGAEVRTGASVFDAFGAEGAFSLRVFQSGTTLDVRARRVVLATGARELFLPFPGWTLPGVVGAGAAQALVKSGTDFRGRTAVVAGSGPLLLAAAAGLSRAGARVALVAEQADLGSLVRFAAALVSKPAKLAEGIRHRLASAFAPYRTGLWVKAAGGEGRVERAQVTNGIHTQSLACDLLCAGWGLVPNLELPRLLGCAVESERTVVDERQETSLPGVFAAGEVCGIAGVEAAVAEGEIAGLGAAGALRPESREARRLVGARGSARRFESLLARTFRLRPEVLRLADAETIVCRCEDVPFSGLLETHSMREAKLHTRAGMGACQGRVCGAALAALRGFAPDSVRPPVVTVPIEALAAPEESS